MNSGGKSGAGTGKIAFQEAWQRDFPGTLSFAVSRNGGAIAILQSDGQISLLDLHGKELFRKSFGTDLRTLSVAESLDLLAVTDTGHSLLIGPMGDLIWKKRLFPALFGVIAASGQCFAFVTREPTVVMTDRLCRVKWTHRNLQNVPHALDISSEGQTTAFHCVDQNGNGVAAIGYDSKAFDSFMGLDPVLDLALNASGNQVIALDKGRGIFCYNCVRSQGRWKGQLNAPFEGLSFAGDINQTLLFTRDGLLTILNDKGEPIWEQRLTTEISRAAISADGQNIIYASRTGQIGCLRNRSGRDLSRLEFLEITATPPKVNDDLSFRKIWSIDLPTAGEGGDQLLRRFLRPDRMEYLLLWDGADELSCRNESGEEIWSLRFPGTRMRDLAIAPGADLALPATDQGVIGLRLDGIEAFKICGAFQQSHGFANGSFLLRTDDHQLRNYLNENKFSHLLEWPTTEQAPTLRLAGNENRCFLLGETRIWCSADGHALQDVGEHAGNLSFIFQDDLSGELSLGNQHGEIILISGDGEISYRNQLPGGGIAFFCHHRSEDTIFVAIQGSLELFLLQNRQSRKMKLTMASPILSGTAFQDGAILATALDELLYIGLQGEILAKYTFPDKIRRVIPARHPKHFYILGESSLVQMQIARKDESLQGVRYLEL